MNLVDDNIFVRMSTGWSRLNGTLHHREENKVAGTAWSMVVEGKKRPRDGAGVGFNLQDLPS